MPKETRVNSSSLNGRAMVSPYSRGSKVSDSDNSVPHVGDETEWDEAQCPVCIEHPHNAVLLLCSSHKKGCRPFICDTSYRHSNCLDQFRKAAGSLGSQSPPEEHQSKLVCPLCRGAVTGWKVVHPARRFMDSKTRSCSLETCSFSGNYLDLRRHARAKHPSKRPSDPSPTRESNWVVIEQQSEDALAYHSDIGNWEYLLDYHSDIDRWIVEQELLRDESNSDFESEVPDLDDSLIDTTFLGSLSFYNLYSPSLFSDDSPYSGGSISSDGCLGPPSSNSGPSLHNQAGNTFPSHPGENGEHASSHKQEDDLEDVSSEPIYTYRIENSPEHSHLRENPSTSSHRENNLNILRPSNYRGRRENNLDILRPSSHRENAPSSSRRISSYYNWEQHTWSSSRSRQSYYFDRRDGAPEQYTRSSSRSSQSYYYDRRDDAPSARRRFLGSSTGPHSRYYNHEVRRGSGQASARNIAGPSRQARRRRYESNFRGARGPSSCTRQNSRHYRSSSNRY